MDHLPQELRYFFTIVGSLLGLPATYAMFISLLFLNLAAAYGFRSICHPTKRKSVSLIIGLIWCNVLYGGTNTLLLVLISWVMYVLATKQLVAASTLTILSICVLSLFHIYRMMTEYMSWSLDVTSALMLFTAKYSSIAFDIADGKKYLAKQALSVHDHVAEARAKTCLLEIPSLFEYTVFIFDFLGVIAGPIFHARDYLDFIYLRNDFSADQRHSFPIRVVLERFSAAVAIGLSFAVAGLVPQLSFAYISSEAYAGSNFFVKLILVQMMTLTARFKYYFAWYMADTACLIAGIAYNPSSREKYSRSLNAVISKVDWANCQAEAMSYWNISISRWLRSYIYLRAIESPVPLPLRTILGHRQYATILTRFVSAFWHGFYPGYYLAFLCTVLQFEADTAARKFLKPFFRRGSTPHWIYTFVGKIHTAVCLNFYGSAFVILSASGAFQVWSSLYFSIHLLNLGTIILLPMLSPPKRAD